MASVEGPTPHSGPRRPVRGPAGDLRRDAAIAVCAAGQQNVDRSNRATIPLHHSARPTQSPR